MKFYRSWIAVIKNRKKQIFLNIFNSNFWQICVPPFIKANRFCRRITWTCN